MIRSGLPIQDGRTPRWSRTSSSPTTCGTWCCGWSEPHRARVLPRPVRRHHGPGHGRRPGRSRWPTPPAKESGQLEFVIKVYPDGLFSQLPGRRAGRRRPARRRRARSGSSPCARAATCDLVFVGGGAGMAPILSLLRSLAERGSTRKATYYYGARRRRDLCFEKELAELEARLPDFRLRAGPVRAGRGGLGRRGRPDHRRRAAARDATWPTSTAYVCGPPPMVEAAMDAAQRPGRARQAHLLRQVHHHRTVLIRPRTERRVSDDHHPGAQSSPKPDFTDAEAGAKEFPDSTARTFNYFTPAEAQAVALRGRHRRGAARPAALPAPGLALRLLRRPRRLPAGLDRAQGVGLGPAGARALPRLRRQGLRRGRPPAGTSSATPTRSGSSRSTATTPTWCARSTRTSRRPGRPRRSSSGTPTGSTFVERHIGAWMHVEHGLGLYLFANANRRAPTNMHNNAISVNSMHRIRFAQDLALYNLTLSEEIEASTARRTSRRGTATRPGRACARWPSS